MVYGKDANDGVARCRDPALNVFHVFQESVSQSPSVLDQRRADRVGLDRAGACGSIMPQQVRRAALTACAVLLLSGCASQESRSLRHTAQLDSLRATTKAIVNAWLQGDVSGAYASTALDQTFRQVEQERAAVATTPDALTEPRANALVRDSEHLLQVIAALADDVRARAGWDARRHLRDLATPAPEHR